MLQVAGQLAQYAGGGGGHDLERAFGHVRIALNEVHVVSENFGQLLFKRQAGVIYFRVDLVEMLGPFQE
ncbi:MAG TPA: hypothetical protein DCZ92_05335 [Elusimicrobia bacterium]|nr:hypothetical protein [Elusimicrobiota bacterium]